MNSPAHIAPAFCSTGTFPTICRNMGSPPWSSSKLSLWRAPSPAHPGGMGAKTARPSSETIRGCFPWKYAPSPRTCARFVRLAARARAG